MSLRILPPPDEASDSASTKRGEFFAVGREEFIKATELGLNAAGALLILARGSGSDNVTTSWSADSVRRHTPMKWPAAKAAISQLIDAGLASIDKPGTRPRYKLARSEESIWLPNTIVDGAGAEVAPLKRLLLARDVLTLRLFVELYAEQNLPDHEGLPQELFYIPYKDREAIGRSDDWVLWKFGERAFVELTDRSDAIVAPHLIEPKRLTAAEKAEWQRKWKHVHKRGVNDRLHALDAFWYRFMLLRRLGLLEIVPYLFDALEDGNPLFPIYRGSTVDAERTLADMIDLAVDGFVPDWKIENGATDGGICVPVPNYITDAALVGIARLHYRPRTRMTAQWFRDRAQDLAEWTESYKVLVYGKAA